ncbi:transglycosylase SLT domain-containing protein [Actinomycetospora sp. NBC_00405]|uniref:transglycosylase SLT domain-containing protein n=1 Tax=Actinomycetospora sp. NBC_00405 TaxID=2975952 RepID=UPI002E1B660D
MAFDAVGELAAQPGGQELSALVARVQQVDPEVLHGMGRRLGSMVEGVDGSLRAVRRHGDDVQGAWQGRGAEALTGYLDGFGRAGMQTLDAAGRIRVRIEDAGRELAALRGEVGAQVSRALDAARRVRSEALADPTRAPMADQLAVQAMAEPTAAARTAVERAETALGDAARALREMTADVVGFSRLPAPDARLIAPAAGGGPLGWSAIPAESLATVPASVDGDVGTQGIDLVGGSASSDVSSVSESSSADDASGSSGGESSECSESGASEADDSGSGNVGDASDLGEGSGSGGGDASNSEASGGDESGSGEVGDSSDLGEGSASGGGDAPVSEASESEESDSGGVGDSSDLGDDFLEEAPESEGSGSGGGDASVSEASGSEGSSSGGVGDSSDLGDDFLEDTSDADAPASDDSGSDDSASEGEDDKGDDKGDDTGGDTGGDEGSSSEAADEDEAGGANSDADADADADAETASDDVETDDAESEDGAVTGTSGDGSGSATDAGAAPTGGPQGQVGDWIREAMAVLQAEGVPVDKMDPDDIATIIEHESGGDPEATNNWDSNADKGTPSQGLMQTIGPTFDAHKLPGHGEITDPIDNIIAGVRYAIDRYGSVSQVPGVEAVARGDSYVGY